MRIAPVLRRLPAALLALAALAFTGCAKKATAVDPSYTRPEGVSGSGAKLVVYPDLATYEAVFLDLAPAGPDTGDIFVGIEASRVGPEGTVHGMVFDQTAANGYQVLRSEAGGGLRELKDFLLPAQTKYLDTGWECYPFDDPDPARVSPTTYVARGALDGQIGANAPVTNVGAIGDSLMADLPLSFYPALATIDSAFTLEWDPVPGAAGYWFQVYQFRSDLRSFGEVLLSGVPAPIYVGKEKDIYLAYLPASVTRYKIGDPATILTRKLTHFGEVYFARVSAVDANGRLIAFSYGDIGVLPVDLGYVIFPFGAIIVEPGMFPPSSQLRALPLPEGSPLRGRLQIGGQAVARLNAANTALRGTRRN